jgi:hypothetical protein
MTNGDKYLIKIFLSIVFLGCLIDGVFTQEVDVKDLVEANLAIFKQKDIYMNALNILLVADLEKEINKGKNYNKDDYMKYLGEFLSIAEEDMKDDISYMKLREYFGDKKFRNWKGNRSSLIVNPVMDDSNENLVTDHVTPSRRTPQRHAFLYILITIGFGLTILFIFLIINRIMKYNNKMYLKVEKLPTSNPVTPKIPTLDEEINSMV